MTPDQVERLAALANCLRPDWPISSLRTFIGRNLSHRAYGDTAVAIAYVTTKTDTNTPRLLVEAGPWWHASDDKGTPRRPHREAQCFDCGHELPCGCKHASPRRPAAPSPEAVAAHVAAAKAALRGER